MVEQYEDDPLITVFDGTVYDNSRTEIGEDGRPIHIIDRLDQTIKYLASQLGLKKAVPQPDGGVKAELADGKPVTLNAEQLQQLGMKKMAEEIGADTVALQDGKLMATFEGGRIVEVTAQQMQTFRANIAAERKITAEVQAAAAQLEASELTAGGESVEVEGAFDISRQGSWGADMTTAPKPLGAKQFTR